MIDGKWVILVEDELFDRAYCRVLTIAGGTVRDNFGRVGMVSTEGFAVALEFQPVSPINGAEGLERIVVDRWDIGGTRQGGSVYSRAPGSCEPLCQPCALIEDASADTMFLSAQARYSSVDVSMYDIATLAYAGFFDADTDAELKAVLDQLPLAKMVMNDLYRGGVQTAA
jgi:hypothetical protein